MHTTHSLLLALAIALNCARDRPEKAAEDLSQPPESPMTPLFDGGKAFWYLKKQVSFGPRNPNSEGHRRCLEYLTTTLRQSADLVRVQNFTERGYDGENLKLANVIASFAPAKKQRILLCAHWDTRPRAERDENPAKRSLPILGANDGASGVAVLLELATVLKTAPPVVGVDIVLFDGEDYGKEGDLPRYLLGSQYFAKNKPQDYIPRFGILLDMVGDAALELPQEGNSLRFAGDVVDLVWQTAESLGYTQFIREPGDEVYDDHVPLNRVGIKTIDIIDFNYPDHTNRYWHTHQDIPEHCSAQSLQAVGSVLAHVIYGMKK